MSRTFAAVTAVGLLVAGSPFVASTQTPTSLTLPASMTCGSNTTGKVNLGSPAPVGGLVIPLSSSNPTAASVPASVTVAAKAMSAVFNVTCKQVPQAVAVTISASANKGTQTALINVLPLALAGITVDPHAENRGLYGRASLNGPAPHGGVVVTLTSVGPIRSITGDPGGRVEGSVTVPAGKDTARFFVEVYGVQQPTTATITGAGLGKTERVNLTVLPPKPALQFTGLGTGHARATVVGGKSQTVGLLIHSIAPAGGLIVQLSSSNAAVASVPVSMVIPPGTGGGTFTVSTVPVAQTSTVTLSGSVGGVASEPAKNLVLTVEAPRLDRFEVVPGSVIGGQSAEGRVSLNGPAPAGGTTVQLSNNNTAAATVPATITIPQGQHHMTVTISTVVITQVSQTRLVTITATVGGVTKSAKVNVVPPGP